MKKKTRKCTECNGTGEVETYPPYLIDAIDGAGNISGGYMDICNNCDGRGFIQYTEVKKTPTHIQLAFHFVFDF